MPSKNCAVSRNNLVVGLRGIPINHSLGQGYRDSSPLRPHGVPAIIALVRALRK
jgi:hypothetical protein